MSDRTEALARALCAADGHVPDADDPMMRALRPYAIWERYVVQATRILADPGPLLDALPDGALIEALVRRGVLVEEEAIEQTRTDGTRGYVIEHLDGRRTSHEDAWLPRTVPVSRYVTDWQEADR